MKENERKTKMYNKNLCLMHIINCNKVIRCKKHASELSLILIDNLINFKIEYSQPDTNKCSICSLPENIYSIHQK